jgi:hypothetical protein
MQTDRQAYYAMSVNPLKRERILIIFEKFSSHLTGNTLPLHFKDQPFNAVEGNNCGLFLSSYET